MESGANALYDFELLLFWDGRLGQGHGVLIFLMTHGGLGTCYNVRVENLGFDDSNPRMDM